MAKYEIKQSCGHTQEYQLFGKSAERARKIEWLENQLCTECKKLEIEQARAEKSNQAASEAEENGFPSLQGTEKQIAWAEVIRNMKLKRLDEILAMAGDEEENKLAIEIFSEGVDAVKGIDAAHWWIENRDSSLWYGPREFWVFLLGGEKYWPANATEAQLLARAIAHLGGLRPSIDAEIPAQVIADAKAEATVRPESPLTETVAEIHIVGQEVHVSFPEKIESFRLLMRGKGYDWRQGYWGRSLNSRNGATDDRAAEIGNALLKAGFIIRCFIPEIRAKAIAADFEPEHTRWILRIFKGDYAGWFAVSWDREEDFYDAARRLHGSKYSKPYVVVPAESFEEVLDFADRYGFKIGPSAQDLAEQAKANKEASLIASPADKSAPKPVKLGKSKPPKLSTPTEADVSDDLQDN